MSKETKNIINTWKKVMSDNLKYTHQDYESMMRQFIDIVKSGDLPTSWNNLTETDPIVMLFSLFAAHQDIQNYMVDYRIGESYMATARQRDSMIRIANSVGYKIPGYSAARIQYTFNAEDFENEEDADFTLKSYQAIVDNNGVAWTYVGDDLEFSGDEAHKITIDLYQGEPHETEFFGETIDYRSKTKSIGGTNIALDNSYDTTSVIRLFYGGTEFTYTDLVQLTETGDLYFDAKIDVLDKVYLEFVPEFNTQNYESTFTLKYITTLGDVHITPSETTQISLLVGEDTLVSKKMDLIQESFYRGKDMATEEEIKAGYKRHYSGITSLINVWDYYNYIQHMQRVLPDVSKVLVLDKQVRSDDMVGSDDVKPNTIAIYFTILDRDTQTHREPTKAEEEKLLADLKGKKVSGIAHALNNTDATKDYNTKIQGDHYLNPITDVSVKINTLVKAEGKTLVTEAIKTYFNSCNLGATVTSKDILDMLTEKELTKYFWDAYSVSLMQGTNPEANTVVLNYNEYFKDVNTIFKIKAVV